MKTEMNVVLVIASCLLVSANAQNSCGFNKTITTVTYPESVTAGSPIYQTTVINKPASAMVTYNLTETGVTGVNKFEITATGLVKLKTGQTLDFETKSSHELTITCSAKTPAETDTLTLTVTVTNVAPTFDKPTYITSIADGATAGTVVGTYKATDPGNSSVTYSIATAGNTNTDFVINATGVVSVAPGKTLNKTAIPSYTLVLQAADAAPTPLTGSTTVTVTVGTDNQSGTSALSASIMAVLAWVLAYCLT